MNHISRRELLKASGAAALSVAAARIGQSSEPADPYADAILVDGEPPASQPGSFCFAVLPDTQNYSENYPETFSAQTEWIVASRSDRNIQCVLHLGDITNHNAQAEWENAVKAMRVLDGKLPYFLVPGNHDYSAGGECTDRTTALNDYFPVAGYRELPSFGGTYDKEPERLENSYHLLSAGGCPFLVLALEFGPRRDVVRWANEVVARYPDRAAILITHAYMYFDDTRYDWKKYGANQSWNPHDYAVARATNDDVLDGEELWNELISRHENFVMTINGHVVRDGLGRLTSATAGGRNVHQLLVNFQMRPKGGDGWLRLLEFRPDRSSLQVYDYSPTRNQHNTSPQNQFQLPMAGIVRT
jgi:3',5'-cyclic AMP phosphodiesterase CpdA